MTGSWEPVGLIILLVFKVFRAFRAVCLMGGKSNDNYTYAKWVSGIVFERVIGADLGNNKRDGKPTGLLDR